jgi:hypothetical protein
MPELSLPADVAVQRRDRHDLPSMHHLGGVSGAMRRWLHVVL